MTTYNTELADRVKDWLDDQEFNYDFDAEEGIVRYGLTLNNSKLSELHYVIRIQQDKILFYAICDVHVAEEYRIATAEFLCRANYGLSLGCFEFDFNDGEIRYRMTANCKNLLPTEEVLDDCFILPSVMFKRYGDELISVIYGFDNPKDAVEKAEQKLEEEQNIMRH